MPIRLGPGGLRAYVNSMSNCGTNGLADRGLDPGRERLPLRIRVSPNQVLFIAAAFPFLVPLIGSTDTQPTFTALAIILGVIAALQCREALFTVQRSLVILGTLVLLAGGAWLCASILMNAPDVGNLNRQVSFLMFLVALTTGILNRNLITRGRIVAALLVYLMFTGVFFATKGAVEGLIIRSRSEEGLLQLFVSGRGASTLSPEPSFFAFQVFTLFLLARLTIWDQLGTRARHFICISSIGLLASTLGGYGMVYAAMVAILAGWRYVVLSLILAAAAVAAVLALDMDSLRFVRLLLAVASSLGGNGLEFTDVSVLVRLTSFSQYLATFADHAVFGDGFLQYGGGGLISLLAALGLFGVVLLILTVALILTLVPGLRLKLVMLAWLVLQTISGPIGLPFVGLTIGVVLSRGGSVRDTERLRQG